MLRILTSISLIWSQGKQQFHHLMTMLALNPMTLFYWDLSNPLMKRFKHSIESWTKSISANTKPESQANHSQANYCQSNQSNHKAEGLLHDLLEPQFCA